jgi:hypothetical protein
MSTIQFDDKARRMAGEIDKIRSDCCLATEVRGSNGVTPEMLPQLPFGIGCVAA